MILITSFYSSQVWNVLILEYGNGNLAGVKSAKRLGRAGPARTITARAQVRYVPFVKQILNHLIFS